jgi:hypothetical protein
MATSPQPTPLPYSLTSQTAHFLEGAILARHLLLPTVTSSSPSSLPTSQCHIFWSLLAFGPLQEVATRKDLPINKEEQQKENIKENNERSIGKQKIDE